MCIKLTLRDFAFMHDREIGGLTYQHGPYLILVGRSSYAVTYKGQTFSWDHESIHSAIEAVNKHGRQRVLTLIPGAYEEGK
jgi:hypothetical protein